MNATLRQVQVIERLVSMMDKLHDWVDEIPPLQQPMRFGNQAFRQWHARLVDRSPDMIKDLLPPVGDALPSTRGIMCPDWAFLNDRMWRGL